MNTNISNKSIRFYFLIVLILLSFLVFPLKTQAASNNTKALKAYSKLLGKSSIEWGTKYNTKYLWFATVDINNDGTSELILYNSKAKLKQGYSKIYTYVNGKVICVWTGPSYEPYIYPKLGIILDNATHDGSTWIKYSKFNGKKVTELAEYTNIQKHNSKLDEYYHVEKWTISGKVVKASKYHEYTEYVLKNDPTPYTMVKNTSKNRTKYLSK